MSSRRRTNLRLSLSSPRHWSRRSKILWTVHCSFRFYAQEICGLSCWRGLSLGTRLLKRLLFFVIVVVREVRALVKVVSCVQCLACCRHRGSSACPCVRSRAGVRTCQTGAYESVSCLADIFPHFVSPCVIFTFCLTVSLRHVNLLVCLFSFLPRTFVFPSSDRRRECWRSWLRN